MASPSAWTAKADVSKTFSPPRFWRSVKYEEVYLHAYDDPKEARANIGRYLNFYNNDRPHQALGCMTPKAFYEHDVAKRATKRAA